MLPLGCLPLFKKVGVTLMVADREYAGQGKQRISIKPIIFFRDRDEVPQ
jgi:hypothetical protein